MRYFLIKLSLIVTIIGYSKQMQAIDDFQYCELSPIAINNYEPLNFEKTNNLLKKPGQDPNYCGEAVIIYGRVVDQNCSSLAGVKVNIWQAGCNQKYPYSFLRTESTDPQLAELESKLTFTGNGTATTNNKGEFYFITIYPPSMHDLSPHVNIRLDDRQGMERQLRLTLKDSQVKNIKADPELEQIANYALAHGMKIYKFRLVIPSL